jgi:hypothetical protein
MNFCMFVVLYSLTSPTTLAPSPAAGGEWYSVQGSNTASHPACMLLKYR